MRSTLPYLMFLPFYIMGIAFASSILFFIALVFLLWDSSGNWYRRLKKMMS